VLEPKISRDDGRLHRMRIHENFMLDLGANSLITFGLILAGILFAVYRHYRVRVRQRTRMKPRSRLDGFVGQQLRWIQTVSGVNDYELYAGDELVATLHFPPTWGVKRSAATGETVDGCWTFKSAWGGDAAIYAYGTENEVGRFRCDKENAGVLELPDRRKLLLLPITNWMSRPSIREFQNESGVTLVRLTSTPGWTRRSGTVLIQPNAANLPELPWVVMLMWYLAMAKASSDSVSSS